MDRLPKALTSKENAQLFEQYSKTHSPEIKERIFYGNMRLVAKHISLYGKQCLKYENYEDLLQQGFLRLYDKCIDGYVEKMASSPNKFTFSTYLTWQLFSMLSTIKHRGNQSPCESYDAQREDESTFQHFENKYLIESSASVEAREIDIEYDYIKSTYFKYLSPEERYVLNEYYFGERYQSEIADEMNMKQSGVSRKIKSTVQKLHKYCEKGAPEQ